MHNDRPHAHRFHEHDVEQHVPQGVRLLHDATAELDDGDLVAEPANPTEGFDQHIGLLYGFVQLRRLSNS